MSHGGSGSGSLPAAEPNLTPLLDVVLQLLMFFMMCVNFVTEQVNEDIKLPDSQSAKPMSKDGIDTLLLNLQPFHRDEQAVIGKFKPQEVAKFHDGEAMATALLKPPFKLTELNSFLKQQYEDAARLSKDGQVHTVIILRPHKDLQYDEVYRVLQMCKTIGYREMHVRAISKGRSSR
jgi:biopolymer transport protein ExbD